MKAADFTGEYVVFPLLAINFLIAAGFLVSALLMRGEKRRGIRRQYLLSAVCVLLGPVIVPVVMLLGHLLSKLLYRNAGDLAAVTFSKNRVEIATAGDFETETNFVPIREALSISDAARLRKLLLDVLRNGPDRALPQLSEALQSPDSETSHYAASAIVDALSDFRRDAAAMDAVLRQKPDDTETGVALLALLITFLPQGVLHDNELDLYTKMAGDVAEHLFETAPDALTAADYLGLVNAYIDIGQIEAAELWSDRAYTVRAGELETFVGRLRLSFEQQDNDVFFETLAALKRSGITVDKHTMELIRLLR